MGRSWTKRVFDICGAGFGLLVLWPLGLLIAALIKLSDHGPVFYRQVRVGQFGRPFRIWKFRSMVAGADRLGAPVTGASDPRTTRLGRLLRKAKLDELPQLWNVLVGEMSFVGPRPEVPRYVALYTLQQREILNYKPGITDLATLCFRNEEGVLGSGGDLEHFYAHYCLPYKIELNRQYAATANVARDLWIILRTVCPYWLGALLLYSLGLACSLWLAYVLRADFQPRTQDFQEFKRWLPWLVAPQLFLLAWQGQLRGMLSYFSLLELQRTLVALGAALLVQVSLCPFYEGTSVSSRSLLFLDFLLSAFALCGLRLVLRGLRELGSASAIKRRRPPRRVALLGTGALATSLAHYFTRNPCTGRRVVAFFDDDPRAWHKRPYNIPVAGMPECLLNQEWRGKIDEVIVALPERNSPRLEQLLSSLKQVPVQVVLTSDCPLFRPPEE